MDEKWIDEGMRVAAGLHGEPLLREHVIAGAATSVAAFVGWASEGPVGKAVVVKSWLEYGANFGALVPGAWMGYAVWQFFENGGTEAYVVVLGDGTTEGIGEPLLPNTEAFETLLTGPGGYVVLQGLGFNLLCVPGENTAAVVGELLNFCAGQKAFLIVDAAETANVAGLVSTGPADGAGVSLVTSGAENAGFYFPWVMVEAPVPGGAAIPMPPSGLVAGVIAAVDAGHGVWKAPAGIQARLSGAVGLQCELNDQESGALNALGVNCLRTMAAAGTVVWGARTMDGADGRDSTWKYIPVRRMALFLEQSLAAGTQWVVFEPNGETLWGPLRMSVEAFMQGLFAQGGLQGITPQQAYFVKCDAENNPDVQTGVVNITVGFAPLVPAEFVVIAIQQMVGEQTGEGGKRESGKFALYGARWQT